MLKHFDWGLFQPPYSPQVCQRLSKHYTALDTSYSSTYSFHPSISQNHHSKAIGDSQSDLGLEWDKEIDFIDLVR